MKINDIRFSDRFTLIFIKTFMSVTNVRHVTWYHFLNAQLSLFTCDLSYKHKTVLYGYLMMFLAVISDTIISCHKVLVFRIILLLFDQFFIGISEKSSAKIVLCNFVICQIKNFISILHIKQVFISWSTQSFDVLL